MTTNNEGPGGSRRPGAPPFEHGDAPVKSPFDAPDACTFRIGTTAISMDLEEVLLQMSERMMAEKFKDNPNDPARPEPEHLKVLAQVMAAELRKEPSEKLRNLLEGANQMLFGGQAVVSPISLTEVNK
jgi:hypothetical protein